MKDATLEQLYTILALLDVLGPQEILAVEEWMNGDTNRSTENLIDLLLIEPHL